MATRAYSSDIEAQGSITTPCGTLQISVGNGAICACSFVDKQMSPFGSSSVLDAALHQMERYFAGQLTQFDLPINPTGTPFQQSVWQAMLEIPYGATISYGKLAHRIGHPTASRAVAAACGANPIVIIIPCHRVVAAHDIGGYTPGIRIKQYLLDFETLYKSSNL
ncbi:MAG: methylated-DNA--[protein]-cysteine S-methyltransferase [Muribaculaceae bacterium]